jgi:hypothetical protein
MGLWSAFMKGIGCNLLVDLGKADITKIPANSATHAPTFLPAGVFFSRPPQKRNPMPARNTSVSRL